MTKVYGFRYCKQMPAVDIVGAYLHTILCMTVSTVHIIYH